MKWQKLEDWISATEVVSFNSLALAEELRVSRKEASELIQSYLSAQRSRDPRTKYVLKRKGRTTAAVWSVGERTSDVIKIGKEFAEDVKVRLTRAVMRDLEHVAVLNPRTRRKVESVVSALAEGAVPILVAAVNGDEE